ncbi:Trypsin-4, partial [Pseudolycoriella hygida]
FVAKVITFLFYFQCISIISGQQTFVIDGDEVDISAAPYMLSLRRLGHHICGASVISKYWTITAAHCLIKTVPSQVTLRGGNRNRFLGQLFNAERIVLHPNFNINYDFDVAVLKTVQQLIEKDNLIRPIALGLQGTYSEAGSLGTVAGWGITEVSQL